MTVCSGHSIYYKWNSYYLAGYTGAGLCGCFWGGRKLVGEACAGDSPLRPRPKYPMGEPQSHS